MSNNILITNNTTADSLFQEMYEQNPSDFGQVYSELISSQPEYKELINEAWIKSKIGRASCRERVCQYV